MRRRSQRSVRRACSARRSTGVPARTPVIQASARDARTPDRAAKIAVNPAKASGASDSVNDAADGSMPATAM